MSNGEIPTKPECSFSAVKGHSMMAYTTGSFLFTLVTIICAYSLVGVINRSLIMAGMAALGATTMASIGAAVAGAATIFVTVYGHYATNCKEDFGGISNGCMAGVIDRIVNAFDDNVDNFFAFTATHDQINVVVKSKYWSKLNPPIVPSAFISCNTDSDRSPLVYGFFRDPSVCAAGEGATIGAALGAVAGVALGILAGAALGGALGCTASGPFYALCLAAVILVALIVAGAVTLAGAIIGGQIGRRASEESTPTGEEEDTGERQKLYVGDYVSLHGNLTAHPHVNYALAFWFVEETTIHGKSNSSPPFSYKDPDEFFKEDSCPPLQKGDTKLVARSIC